MLVQRRHAPMAIMDSIHTRVRPTATMVRDGSQAASSSAPARGITAITDADTVSTGQAMATTGADTLGPARIHTTGEVVFMLADTRAARLAGASTVADADKRNTLAGTRLAANAVSRFVCAVPDS